jgi:hypothetical protein
MATMRRPADHQVEEALAKATEDDKSQQVDDKSPWRSLWYVARDVAVVAALGAAAAATDSWVVWPLYWAAQGTMFWALFVLEHDWYVRRAVRSSSRPGPLIVCFFLFLVVRRRRRSMTMCIYVMCVLVQWSRELLGQPDAQQRGWSSPPLLHPNTLPWMVCSSIRSIPPCFA